MRLVVVVKIILCLSGPSHEGSIWHVTRIVFNHMTSLFCVSKSTNGNKTLRLSGRKAGNAGVDRGTVVEWLIRCTATAIQFSAYIAMQFLREPGFESLRCRSFFSLFFSFFFFVFFPFFECLSLSFTVIQAMQ